MNRKRRHRGYSALALTCAIIASVAALWVCMLQAFPHPGEMVVELIFAPSSYWLIPLIIGALSVELAHKCIPRWDQQERIAGTMLSMGFSFAGTVVFILVIRFI